MADYYKDLENRIQLLEGIISKQNEQINQLETDLLKCCYVYEVNWYDDTKQSLNWSICRTFEGACTQLLLLINQLKTPSNMSLEDMANSVDTWKISKQFLLDHCYWKDEEIGYVHEDILWFYKNGRIMSYSSKDHYKIFCKIRKKINKSLKNG